MRAAGTVAETLPQRRATARFKWFALVAALLAIFIAANAHLIYVAIQSQPECVVQSGGDAMASSILRPAKPAC